jgi:hypothetical protein
MDDFDEKRHSNKILANKLRSNSLMSFSTVDYDLDELNNTVSVINMKNLDKHSNNNLNEILSGEFNEWKKDIEKSLEKISERVALNSSTVLINLLEKRVNDMNSDLNKVKKTNEESLEKLNQIVTSSEKLEKMEKLIKDLVATMKTNKINTEKIQGEIYKTLNEFGGRISEIENHSFSELEKFLTEKLNKIEVDSKTKIVEIKKENFTLNESINKILKSNVDEKIIKLEEIVNKASFDQEIKMNGMKDEIKNEFKHCMKDEISSNNENLINRIINIENSQTPFEEINKIQNNCNDMTQSICKLETELISKQTILSNLLSDKINKLENNFFLKLSTNEEQFSKTTDEIKELMRINEKIKEEKIKNIESSLSSKFVELFTLIEKTNDKLVTDIIPHLTKIEEKNNFEIDLLDQSINKVIKEEIGKIDGIY